ncbi:unnamed protein product [Paramecium sonneborni]|uniref:Uncharacterized protein n=1 Tax=Paramecium sonneborni TaxID=65129 RepID=A0A8S1RMY1_9CILI|nr:unnamed protein product [Paramecium sonneborni]
MHYLKLTMDYNYKVQPKIYLFSKRFFKVNNNNQIMLFQIFSILFISEKNLLCILINPKNLSYVQQFKTQVYSTIFLMPQKLMSAENAI